VKRRSRLGYRHLTSRQRKAHAALTQRGERKRKSWTFERLEERNYFTATPTDVSAAVLDTAVIPADVATATVNVSATSPQAQLLQTVSFANDTAAGEAATLAHELGWAAMQVAYAQGQELDPAAIRTIPNDPLFVSQWHLLNTGQEVGSPDFPPLYGVAGEDINVVPVWDSGVTGKGVTVAVIDSGVQLTHPDLLGNLSTTLRFNATDGGSNAGPNLNDPTSFHGTSVAGLIGATWNNLGNQVVDSRGNLVFDVDGNPVFHGGGVGVAPDVTLVPIRIGIGLLDQNIVIPFDQQVVNAFQYAIQNGVDITNNSWGPADNRTIATITPDELQVLRDSVIFGRGGLGMINVWASGNGGGPSFGPGFTGFGSLDSATYDPFVSSRYTIGVTGVDHDGLYANADGTFTSYPEAGAGVLVAAPTGSNVAQDVGQDTGQGSGLWTTDLTSDFGANAEPLKNGFEPDADLLRDPDYTSRFNGTSASAPVASGVIALMLSATDPDGDGPLESPLTYRDVQEILVRSARQAGQFEIPSSGGGLTASYSTYQTNQIGPFRDPDPWRIPAVNDRVDALFDPLADPTLGRGPSLFPSLAFYDPASGNDDGRQFGHYEAQPGLFANDAGYTVSQGYGVYGESIGFAHGVIDADLAVKMAKQWVALGQHMAPLTEKTFTTFVLQPGLNLPAAEEMANNGLLVPGGIGGRSGFIAHWNEYFAQPPGPFDPANQNSWPQNTRGLSYLDFTVPPSQEMNVEWVEVKISVSGSGDAVNFLKINLTSPNGTQSELNHYYGDISFIPTSVQSGLLSAPATGWFLGAGPLTPGGLVYTFTTNRNWGESTNSAVIIDPVTGEPAKGPADFATGIDKPMFRDWELHVENWSGSAMGLSGLEIVWHGKAINGGQIDQNWQFDANGQLTGWQMPVAQRIQGVVVVDTNGDGQFSAIPSQLDPNTGLTDTNQFNNRYIQEVFDPDLDPTTIRSTDVVRTPFNDADPRFFQDNNHNAVYDAGDVRYQEPYAANVVVQAFHFDVVNGVDVVDATPTAQFLTGADGNFYFDLVPDNYIIRVVDPQSRAVLDDVDTPALAPVGFAYQPHYLHEWRITADWFVAPDRDNPPAATLSNNPGEIFFDPTTQAPVPFQFDPTEPPIPMAVNNINFMLKADVPAQQFAVQGHVYRDLNGDGIFNQDDSPAPDVYVYQDVNRNGAHDQGEQQVLTDSTGFYTLTIPTNSPSLSTYSVGVIPPVGFTPSDPGGDGVEDIFGKPGYPLQTQDFFLIPPDSANPPGGTGTASLQGVVFNDFDQDGVRDLGDNGVSGLRVFLDIDQNGAWNSATEPSTVTASNGSYAFANIAAGLYRVDVVIPNEGTPAAAWVITTPAVGYRDVQLGPGGNATGISFGLLNRASDDWGNLPDSFHTTAASNGPHHLVVQGFQLGTSVDGEVDGIPTANASGSSDNDGVQVTSNGGILVTGTNTLHVTVVGVGGTLTGWMDFNNDGTFDSSERLNWSFNGTSLGGEADLSPGGHDLQINVPAGAVGGRVMASRFRWGEPGLSFDGPSIKGEVEDYFFNLNFISGDFNRNGTVDQADFALWQKTKNQNVTPFSGADANGDGVVNQADLDIWQANFGKTLPPPGAGAGSGALMADAGSSSSSAGQGSPSTSSSGGSAAVVDSTSSSGGTSGQSFAPRGGAGSLASSQPAAPVVAPAESIVTVSTPTAAPTSDVVGAATSAVTTPVVTPPAGSAVATPVASGPTVSSEPTFAALMSDTSTSSVEFASMSNATVSTEPVATDTTDASLLLLDAVLAEFDDRSDDDAERSLDDDMDGPRSDVADNLVLSAAVFEDESDWWKEI
jgi:hypothetical protein